MTANASAMSQDAAGFAPVEVLTVSDMCVDIVMSGDVRPRFGQVEQLVDSCFLTVGGSANIFASQFAKLGGSIGLIGEVGNDAFGSFLHDALSAAGIRMERVRRNPGPGTGISVALAESHDRAILTWPGTIHAIGPEEIERVDLTGVRHWHIASFFLMERLLDAWLPHVRRLKEVGISVSLDPNWDPAERWTAVEKVLPYVDIFLPNVEEACAIAGVSDWVEAGQRLGHSCGLVVIKRGGEGTSLFQDGRQLDLAPEPIAVEDIRDTVGAGDNFDAGFLHSWLAGGSLEEAAATGNRCGRASLAASGGVDGQIVEAK